MDIKEIDFDCVFDDLIEICKVDMIIGRFIQVYSFYKKIEVRGYGFDKTPTEQEIEDDLEEMIIFVISEIKSGIFSTEMNIFNLETDRGKILFLKEEILKELCFVICVCYGNSSTEDGVNQEIERELIKISINEDMSFLENVYANVISKKHLMNLVTPTLFLSNFIQDDKISEIDYDLIVEAVPSMIRVIFETNVSIRANDNFSSFEVDEYEDVSEENVRNFISFMVDEIRTTNTDFCQELTSGLIAIGRTNK